VSFDVEVGYPAKSQFATFRKSLIAAVKGVAGVSNVSVNLSVKIASHSVQRGVQLLPNVKNIVAVASGKGGVGKSTTAVNLALALAAEGASVGLLDADIYGPSQPMMMGIEGRPESVDGKNMEPMENFGIQVMSIGFLVAQDEAMIWRGPMATQALEQLLRQTNWREVAQMPLCLLTSEMHNRSIVDSVFAKLDASVKPVMETDSILALALSVVAGDVCSVLPGALVGVVRSYAELEALPLVQPEVSTPVGFITLGKAGTSRALRAALALVRDGQWLRHAAQHSGALHSAIESAHP